MDTTMKTQTPRRRLGGKSLAVATAVVLGAASAAPAAMAQSDSSYFLLRMLGKSGWSIECELQKEDGGVSKPRSKGRGASSSGSIISRDVTTGDCQVSVRKNGSVQIRLAEESAEFKCPFPVAAGSDCVKVFVGPLEESFKVEKK